MRNFDAARRPIGPIVRRMKTLLVLAATAALAGCGVDVATSAATAGQIKKQEIEQGKRHAPAKFVSVGSVSQ